MRGRRRLMRRGEAPAARRFDVARLLAADFVSAAQVRRDGDVARHALLQQQFRRLDHGFGVEARAHRAVEHALAMATMVMPW